MHRLLTISLLALTLLAPAAASSTPVDFNNGCGPEGWLGTLVPDELGNCKFQKSCAAHDGCYSACLPGGSLHSQVECLPGNMSRSHRKSVCDLRFQAQIVEENDGRCQELARFYGAAVRLLGGGLFNGKQIAPLLAHLRGTGSLEQQTLRLRLLQDQAARGAIRLQDLQIDADALRVPARPSLKSLLVRQGQLTVPQQMQLSEQRLAPLLSSSH